VSVNHITERLIRLYMKLRENFTQEVAASKTSISVSTAGLLKGSGTNLKRSHCGVPLLH
jgi:hypothetical protein